MSHLTSSYHSDGGLSHLQRQQVVEEEAVIETEDFPDDEEWAGRSSSGGGHRPRGGGGGGGGGRRALQAGATAVADHAVGQIEASLTNLTASYENQQSAAAGFVAAMTRCSAVLQQASRTANDAHAAFEEKNTS